MKIILVQHAQTFRGPIVSLQAVAESLVKRGHDVYILLENNSKEIIAHYKNYNIKCINIEYLLRINDSVGAERYLWNVSTWKEYLLVLSKWNKYRKQIKYILEAYKPDIIHINSISMIPMVLILRKLNAPFVWHIREYPRKHFIPSIKTIFYKKTLRKAKNVCAFLSEKSRDAWGGCASAMIVPNFEIRDTENNKLYEETGKEKKNDNEPLKIIYLGGLNQLKGVFILINAFKLLKSRGVPFVCTMPGSAYVPPDTKLMKLLSILSAYVGPITKGQKVEKEINKFGLNKSCIRLKFTYDVLPLIEESEILVAPSLKPHFSRPTMEGILLGKVVIGSNLPGINEYIKNGQTGFLIDTGDYKRLALILEKIYYNKEKIIKIGSEAQKNALNIFDNTKCVENLERLYAQIVK